MFANKGWLSFTTPYGLESEAGFRWTCALHAGVECLRITARVIVIVGTCGRFVMQICGVWG